MVREALAQPFKGLDFGRHPLDDIWLCFPEAVRQGARFAGKVSNKPAIILYETQELAQLFLP